MADKPIGQLNEFPTGAPIDGTNTLLVAQYSNAAYKLTGQRFVNALADLLDGHGGIASIEYDAPASGSLVGTMTITLADETVTEVEINNGKGITSIAKTGTSGRVDTYTITYNDGTTSTFTISNGAKGDPGDAWYVHIRYAAHEPTADSDMSTIPDAWIGIYSGTSATAPTAYTAYSWYEFKGAKGNTGDDAQIDSVTAQYQFHTDGAVAPTGTWYNSVSAASAAVSGETQGKYLWSKIDIAYNNEQHCVFYNTAYQGIDGTGLTGVVKSINSTLTPDGNGNVIIDADAISAIPAPASPSDGAVLMYDSDDGWVAGDASSLGTVKSVNTKNPDGNGNVTVGMADISGLNTAINAKYTKPAAGIPKTDLASAVQTSLGKADSAYQRPSTGIPASDLADEVYTTVEPRRLQFTNISVATSAFVEDATYEDFPYKASVPLTGVLSTMTPEVIFGVVDAMSGYFAPIAEAYSGGIYIYATDVPEEATVIPTIICWKAVS